MHADAGGSYFAPPIVSAKAMRLNFSAAPGASYADRRRLPASDFAEPTNRAYPVEDKAHAQNAKARASQATKAGRMSKAEERKMDKKADTVLKKG
jgi:hypothetical protein